MSGARVRPSDGTGQAEPGRAETAALDPIERARRAGVLSALDQQFAERLCGLYGTTDASIRWAAALVCRQTSVGHVCADLPRLAESGLASEDGLLEESVSVLATHRAVEPWLETLRSDRLVEDARRPASGELRPLVLDAAGRLYLKRLHRAEGALASALLRRAERPDLVPLGERAAPGQDVASAGDPASVGDPAPDPAAERALALGLARPLTILTGGPGTGKTTLVARLVRRLARHALAGAGRAPRVLLLAPTGKAAAAMAASFARERARVEIDSDVGAAERDALPLAAETLHRALVRLDRLRRRASGAATGFDADVVVVDEVSMIDLEQMARLVEACEAVPRLVLLGDPGQLASVEAGAVLADLCGEGEGGAPHPALERALVRLTKSHRYAAGGGIGRLAEAVRAGDADRALALLADPKLPDVERVELGPGSPSLALLVESVQRLQSAVASELFPEAKLARLADYRVLCAHRRGPFGVEALARTLDEVAARERHASTRAAEWPGRLLLVTQNAPEQSLWNGDVGLVEREGDALRVLFPGEDGGVRSLSLARLPAHESAIAMSVHKSQGSEFAEVDLVLAAHPTRLMTRELLYTGITRARERLRIHASEAVLRAAIARRARRDSGLADRLRSAAIEGRTGSVNDGGEVDGRAERGER